MTDYPHANRERGFEQGDDAHPIGRDPRRMTQDELRALGHTPMSPTKAIRAHCLDCCAGSPDEVRKCVAVTCPSWPWRMGRNPWRSPKSEAEMEAARERGRKLAEAVKNRASSADSPSPVLLTTPGAEAAE